MQKSLRMLSILVLTAWLAACAGSTPAAQTVDGVRLDQAPPPAGARALGEIKAVDGHGCGLLGTLGTYEGAAALLRQRARAVGADYVHLTAVKEPVATRECVEKTYTLTGVAYRVGAGHAPPSTAPVGSVR